MLDLQQTGIRFSACGERLAAPVITRLMTAALDTPGLLSLAAGFTDSASLPVDPVRQVVGELLAKPGLPEFLQYGTNQGRPGLRELLGERLGRQDRIGDRTYSRDGFFITNGSQQALTLATQVLCDPGDIVLVETPTYFVYLDALRGLGVEARDLPVDEEQRLDPIGLENLLSRMERKGELKRLKAVYLQAYFANPSSRTMAEEAKTALAEVFRRRGLFVPILEDAAYRELHYGQPASERSALAMAAFEGFPRLYLGTLTKSFATGLKVGFGYCTNQDWLDRILYLKGQHDFGTANFAQAVLEKILAEEYFDAYLPELRETYRRKMEILHATLTEEGLEAEGWQWEVPAGGLYLWLKGPAGFDAGIDSGFCRCCLENRVLYVPGDLCFGQKAEKQYVRLSFGALAADDLWEAGLRFVKSVRQKEEV